MKKMFQITLIGAMSLVGWSCHDDQEPSVANDIPTQSVEQREHITYAERNLLLLGSAAVYLASLDEKFKEEIYWEIERTFDGEYNVLIKSLAQPEGIHGRSAKRFHQSLAKVAGSESAAQQALAAFQNVDGRDYFPQIYIPFYEDLRAAGKIGVTNPVVVIGVEDKPVHIGYSLDNNGKLVEFSSAIDEAFARQNEVWVLSINERVDENGEVESEYAGGRGQTEGVFPNARFQRFRVGLHKEEWVAGGSEVHIKRYLSFWAFDAHSVDPHALEVSGGDNPVEGDGKRIYQFTRSDVSQNKLVTVNWVYVDNWPARQGNIGGTLFHVDYLYYIVFEYDAWPTGKRSELIVDTTGNTDTGFVVEYRSADDVYKKSYIPESLADGFGLNDPYIGFNSQY